MYVNLEQLVLFLCCVLNDSPLEIDQHIYDNIFRNFMKFDDKLILYN